MKTRLMPSSLVCLILWFCSVLPAQAQIANPPINIDVISKTVAGFRLLNAFAIEHTPSPVREDKTGERLRVWQMTGPFGGDVMALAADPRNSDTILAGTKDGQLFRSRDGGQIWKRLRPGLLRSGYAVTVIVFDRQRANTIYVGVKQSKDISDDATGGGLFVSDDGGQTWREFPALRNLSIRGLVQASKNANVLVAVARDGIYRTLDRGATWQRITPERDRELTGFHSAAIDPRDVNMIYVGTWHLPWKTFDGGATWKLAGMKDTGMIDDSDIFSIQIDETAPDAMWMSACSGIYRSTDASVNWAKIKGIPFSSRRTPAIFQHPTQPDIVFAGTIEGLWRSNRGGKDNTWTRVTSRIGINAIVVHPQRPERVFVATEHYGILVSEDYGETYSFSNAGFISRQINAVLADHTERGRIYAGVIFDEANGGLYISENGGLSWQQSMDGMGVRDVYSLYQMPAPADTLYAGTNQGLFRSADHGRTWTQVKKAEPEPAALGTGDLAAANPPRLAASKGKSTARKAKSKATPPIRFEPTLVELQNQVNALTLLRPLPTATNPAPAPQLLAVTWDGLYRSEDERKGWKLLQTVLPEPVAAVSPAGQAAALPSGSEPQPAPRTVSALARHGINTLATSAHAPGLILLGTERGLLLSRDNGETFALQALGTRANYRIRIIQFDPRTAGTIYVGTTEGFFRTLDGGATWEQRGGGMPLVVDVVSMSINPRNPDELYLSDALRSGFYHSPNRGRNWESLDVSKLPSARFQTMSADPYEPDRLYVGSFSGGVYVVNRQTRATP